MLSYLMSEYMLCSKLCRSWECEVRVSSLCFFFQIVKQISIILAVVAPLQSLLYFIFSNRVFFCCFDEKTYRVLKGLSNAPGSMSDRFTDEIFLKLKIENNSIISSANDF